MGPLSVSEAHLSTKIEKKKTFKIGQTKISLEYLTYSYLT